MTSSTAYRTSVTLPSKMKSFLENSKNKSKLIADALELYFEKEAFMKSAEKQYWDHVKTSSEYFRLGSQNITENILEETLWK